VLDTEHDDAVAPDRVRHDKGRAWNDQLAGTWHSAGASGFRKLRELSGDDGNDRLDDKHGGFGVCLRDVRVGVAEVFESFRRPEKPHILRGLGVGSFLFDAQDFTQASTPSCVPAFGQLLSMRSAIN
jgi:hypothetical protein